MENKQLDEAKHNAAVLLGRKGGQATLRKHGRKHFIKISPKSRKEKLLAKSK